MQRVEVDGTAIGWQALGEEGAPPIMLLHSLGSDQSMWVPQTGALSADFRVVLADMRGHGASDAPPGPYSMEGLVGDVLAVADAAGIDRFHLCGISIGGQIALSTAISKPERLISVLVCNTAPKFGTKEYWSERIEAIRSGGMESIREAVIDGWFSAGFPETRPDWFAEANDVFASTSVEGYTGCCGVLAVSDLRGTVASIATPTLVVGGELDISAPPAESEWLHNQIPGSSVEIIEGAAHLSNMDRPEHFNQLVADWLADF